MCLNKVVIVVVFIVNVIAAFGDKRTPNWPHRTFFRGTSWLETATRSRPRFCSLLRLPQHQTQSRLVIFNIFFLFYHQQALDSFFLVLSDSGDVFYVSENVFKYLGYTQVKRAFN